MICRICKWEQSPRKQAFKTLIKYAVRHYAHPDCFFHAYGLGGINQLSMAELQTLPVASLSEVAPGREMKTLEAAIQNLKDRDARAARRAERERLKGLTR